MPSAMVLGLEKMLIMVLKLKYQCVIFYGIKSN